MVWSWLYQNLNILTLLIQNKTKTNDTHLRIRHLWCTNGEINIPKIISKFMQVETNTTRFEQIDREWKIQSELPTLYSSNGIHILWNPVKRSKLGCGVLAAYKKRHYTKIVYVDGVQIATPVCEWTSFKMIMRGDSLANDKEYELLVSWFFFLLVISCVYFFLVIAIEYLLPSRARI